jgi:hypothetical protein
MSVTLVHRQESRRVAAVRLISKCTLFKDNLVSPYQVKSDVPFEVFREFLSLLDDGAVEISNANFAGLSLLCTEFGFESLSLRLLGFRSSAAFAGQSGDSETRIARLEERALARDRSAAALEAEVGRLSEVVASLRVAVERGAAVAQALDRGQGRLEAGEARVCAAVDELRAEVLVLKDSAGAIADLRAEVSMLRTRAGAPPEAGMSAAPPFRPQDSPAVDPKPSRKGRSALPPRPTGFASLIVADFPALFAEFRGKRFTLLYRGSRDGFDGSGFSRLCDGHANTLALIQDTDGNIFGGFTPLKWESFSTGHWKADPSLKSFLFTLKNPHNLPPRKFALKADRKDKAIQCCDCIHFCDFAYSSPLGGGPGYWSDLGRSYTNDTGLKGNTVFTGSKYCSYAEVEVFQIND